jgi:hypothetical protein
MASRIYVSISISISISISFVERETHPLKSHTHEKIMPNPGDMRIYPTRLYQRQVSLTVALIRAIPPIRTLQELIQAQNQARRQCLIFVPQGITPERFLHLAKGQGIRLETLLDECAVVESPSQRRRGNRQGRELQHLGSGGNIGQEKEPRFGPAACAEPRVRQTTPDEGVQELLADLATHDDLMSGTLVGWI